MNEAEIDEILLGHPLVRSLYLGSFPIDRLPCKPPRPYALVINYDEARKEGSHWVCLYANHQGIHFHDSYGLPPLKYQIPAFLDPEPYTCTLKALQHKRSHACGHHVITYIVKRAEGVSTKDYLDCFGASKRDNDYAVRSFVKRLNHAPNS